MTSQIANAETRRYVSPRRRQQADETRARIADAARRLLGRSGYGATTMAAVAKEAGVAPQTVYAVFGSKLGLLKALIERAAFGIEYEKLIAQVYAQRSPASRLRFAAKIACEIYESDRAELEFFRRSGVPDSELMSLEQEREGNRFEAQAVMIDLLLADRALRRGLNRPVARDILWALTGREIYRLLVLERRWSAARYQRWLGDLLVKDLLGGIADRSA